jgi:ribosomal protein S18 acetylase RimI-like enzyme
MEIYHNKLDEAEILHLLQRVDSYFKPTPISERVDLHIYAKKLADNASHFYAKENEKLIGMTCCYMNDVNRLKAFISVTCIDPNHFGKGMGRQLTMECENAALSMGFKSIEFEVHIDNLPSIEMHRKIGYIIDRNIDDSHYIMRKNLKGIL